MKFFVWADFDLDGTGSIRVLKWLYPSATVTFKNTKVNAFAEEFAKWQKTDSVDNYDRVFILDLDVSPSVELVDHKKVVIIDHHLSHVNTKDVYKKATVIVEEFSSCTRLMYEKFKEKLKITPYQKLLIMLIDDYDSYKLVHDESLKLNYLFSDMQRGEFPTKVDRFLHEFEEGFKGFNQFQKNIIAFYEQKVQKAIENSQYFSGEVSIAGKKRSVISAITDTAVNDVCQHMLSVGYDLAIVYNPKTQTVSFRTNREDLDVSKVAAKLADGGGHKYAAGGKAGDKFVEFSKILSKIPVP